ncbi:MAG: hypothetical protein ACRDO9_03415, partial [Gaiellales bacterium]
VSGCNSSFDPMHGAICRSVAAGVTYAVAAGNSAANANNFVPATYSEGCGSPEGVYRVGMTPPR